MNELTIISKSQIDSVENMKTIFAGGFVYVIECGNKLVKIGCTERPKTRLKALTSQLEKYGDKKIGRIALTTCHTNYRENEKLVHEILCEKRNDGTELFKISFDEAIMVLTDSILCVDESEKKYQESEQYFLKLKNMFSIYNERFYDCEEEPIYYEADVKLFEEGGYRKGLLEAIYTFLPLLDDPLVNENGKKLMAEKAILLFKKADGFVKHLKEYYSIVDTNNASEEYKTLVEEIMNLPDDTLKELLKN